jgi:pyruvate-formate lyase-activating enzyme
MAFPNLVLSNKKGGLMVHPRLKMMGRDAQGFVRLRPEEVIALPWGSTFYYLPARTAVGWDEDSCAPARVAEFGGEEVFPVAAFMVPGFTRLYLPAAQKTLNAPVLPLWPYAAAGYSRGKFYVAGLKVDALRRQDPRFYRQFSLIRKNIAKLTKEYPENRLFKHLSYCALTYNCRNAQNLFLNRWEAPLPVSPICNARCLGCLSFQGPKDATASHERIRFVPTADEVCEVGVAHLKKAKAPIVSFGQGCEGEPLLQFNILKGSILRMRRATKRGTIHLNTNGCDPLALRELAAAGLDSVRISVTSFLSESYRAYYRPRGYVFEDVRTSIKAARKSGLFVSLNYLVFPGASDGVSQVRALVRFLKKGYVDLLQLRNLSIDPDFFESRMPPLGGRPLGVLEMITLIREECPKLRMGYFNPPKENFML